MIFFDFDGVVVDSLALCRAGCVTAARAQGFEGDLSDNPFADLDPLTFEALGARLGLDPDRYARDVADYVAAQAQIPALFPGMAEVITELARTDRLVVMSASRSDVISRFLTHHNLFGAFARILGGDHPGSKAEKITAELAGNHGGPHCMIGDAVSDIDAARAADVAAIAVGWGWQGVQALSARSPDRLALESGDLLAACRYLLTTDGGSSF